MNCTASSVVLSLIMQAEVSWILQETLCSVMNRKYYIIPEMAEINCHRQKQVGTPTAECEDIEILVSRIYQLLTSYVN